jgi:hypothetical protein
VLLSLTTGAGSEMVESVLKMKWPDKGDQIGRSFAYWAAVFLEHFFKPTKVATFFHGTSYVLTKSGFGYILGDFSQTHLGSMLWSQFSAIFANFRRKNCRFSQKPMLWSKFCIIYLALFWVKNAIFFAEFFGENILKIITLVPGHPDSNLQWSWWCAKYKGFRF